MSKRNKQPKNGAKKRGVKDLNKESQIALRKSNMRLMIGLIIGAILFLLPNIWDTYNKCQQYPMVIQYRQREKELQEQYPVIEKYNKQVIEYQEKKIPKITQSVSSIVKGWDTPLGYLSVPSIHIKNLLVYYGTTDQVLSRGLGNIPWTSLPAGGKNTMAAITGHSGLANRIFFDNIKFLKKGDKIHLETLGKNMTYEVTKKKVIDPNKAGVEKNFYVNKGKDEIVLMTCTPVLVNSHRLLVYAKRVNTDTGKDKIIYRDFWSLTNIWMMIVAGLMLIFIGSYLIQRHRYKKLIKEIKDKERKERIERLKNE